MEELPEHHTYYPRAKTSHALTVASWIGHHVGRRLGIKVIDLVEDAGQLCLGIKFAIGPSRISHLGLDIIRLDNR